MKDLRAMTDEELDAEYPRAGEERKEAIEKESLRRYYAAGTAAEAERHRLVLDTLGPDPIGISELENGTGLHAAELRFIVTHLEKARRIERVGDKWRRKA